MIRTLAAAAIAIALATPAFAGDYHRRVDPGYAHRHGTRTYLDQSRIVGGRAVTSDYYRPYRHRSYGRDYGRSYQRHHGGDTTVIIIEWR
jgi:hypothetical protein